MNKESASNSTWGLYFTWYIKVNPILDVLRLDAIFLYWSTIILDDSFTVLLLTLCLVAYHGLDATVDLKTCTFNEYMDCVKGYNA